MKIRNSLDTEVIFATAPPPPPPPLNDCTVYWKFSNLDGTFFSLVFSSFSLFFFFFFYMSVEMGSTLASFRMEVRTFFLGGGGGLISISCPEVCPYCIYYTALLDITTISVRFFYNIGGNFFFFFFCLRYVANVCLFAFLDYQRISDEEIEQITNHLNSDMATKLFNEIGADHFKVSKESETEPFAQHERDDEWETILRRWRDYGDKRSSKEKRSQLYTALEEILQYSGKFHHSNSIIHCKTKCRVSTINTNTVFRYLTPFVFL